MASSVSPVLRLIHSTSLASASDKNQQEVVPSKEGF